MMVAITNVELRLVDLKTYFEQHYCLLRPLEPNTVRTCLSVLNIVHRWANSKPIDVELFDAQLINQFLKDKQAEGKSPHSLKGWRAFLMALARHAHEAGLAPILGKVRPVKVPQIAPHGWTVEQVRKLLTACRIKRRRQAAMGGIRGCDWWDVYIRIAWDTGFRQEDLIQRAKREQLRGDLITITQGKTKKLITRRLAASTMAVIDHHLPSGREYLLPYSGSIRNLNKQFALIVSEAGLHGSLKHLRKSSGSEVESLNPGFGHQHLGNTAQVFDKNYRVPWIAQQFTPSPRPLDEAAG